MTKPSGQTHYRVTWEIDIWAATPLSAAEQARQIQLDPDSVATVFRVLDVTRADPHLPEDPNESIEIDVAPC